MDVSRQTVCEVARCAVQLRHGELLRSQERLVSDMERAVEKRDVITTRVMPHDWQLGTGAGSRWLPAEQLLCRFAFASAPMGGDMHMADVHQAACQHGEMAFTSNVAG